MDHDRFSGENGWNGDGGDEVLESVGLTTNVEAIYVSMIQNPTWGVEELAAGLRISEEAVRGALNTMAEQALVRPHDDASPSLAAASPHAGMLSLLAKAEADLVTRQGQLDAARAAIAALAAVHDATRKRDEIVRLDGPAAVQERLRELSETAMGECLVVSADADPGPETVEAGQRLKERALIRGVVLREILPESARHRPHMQAYAKWLAAYGVPARTVPDVPTRMLVVDRSVALVPADPEHPDRGALEIRSPGTVAALCLLSEQLWSGGTAFDRRPEADDDGTTPQIRALLRLFEAGHTDESAGRKLGLSARTVRRVVAELTQRLGVSSRFQMGAEAVRQGWI